MKSERLKQQAQGRHGSAPGPLCMSYSFQANISMGLPSVNEGPLILVPALGASFRLLVCQVQTRCDGFCFILFCFVRYGCYLLEALPKHFSMERQKGGRSRREGNGKQDSV